MAGEELSAIISVFLDDQATAGLQALPADVQRTVTRINAELANLGREDAFGKVASQSQLAQASIRDLSNALRVAQEQLDLVARATEALGRTPVLRNQAGQYTSLEQARALTIELERQLALRREVEATAAASPRAPVISPNENLARQILANPNAGGLSDADVAETSRLPVERVRELRQELLLAAAAAGDLLAQEKLLEQQNVERLLASSQGVALAPFAGPNATQQAEAAAAANVARAKELKLLVDREEITGEKNIAAALAEANSLTIEAAAITSALTEARKVEAEATSTATEAEQRWAEVQSLLNGETAQVQERTLAAARAYLQLAAAQGDTSVSTEKLLALQQRAIATTRQLAAAEEQAAKASGGGGGFFGGLGKGLTGGHGGGSGPDLSAANIGRQIGEVARYIYVYEAFFKITEGIKGTIEEVKKFQEGLLSLEIALSSVDQEGAVTVSQMNSIAAAATRVGASPGEGLQLAARGIQAFRSQATTPEQTSAIAIQSTTAALQGQVLAGHKLNDVQTQIIAASREFNLGFQGQQRVLDAATNANRNFGASIEDVLTGLSQVAGLADQSGFSVEQLANAISLISSSTGLSGSAAAGDLKRIIGGEGAPAFQKALLQVGVDTSQNLAHELEELGTKYSQLSEAQQQNVITTLGGRRAAEALIPLLAQVGQYQAANTLSANNAGAAENEFNKRQETLAGILRQVSGGFKALAADIGRSGVGAGFGLALEALIPLLRALDQMVKLFDAIPAPIREATFALGELALAVKLVNGLVETGIFAKIGGGLASKIGLGAKEAAPVIQDAAVLRASSGLGASTTVAARGALTAEEIAAMQGTGLAAGALGNLGAKAGLAARTLTPVAIALTVLDGVLVAGKAADLAGALHQANDAMDQIGHEGTTPDDLQSQISNLSKLQSDLRDKSKGFNGAIADFLDGDKAGKTIEKLEGFKKELAEEITAIGNAASRPGSKTGLGNVQSVEQLDAMVKNLQDSGRSAAGILGVLVTTIDGLSGAGQKAALGLANVRGGITTGENPEQFITDILDKIPSNTKQLFSSANITEADRRALFVKLFGNSPQISNGGINGAADPQLAANFAATAGFDRLAAVASQSGGAFSISDKQRHDTYARVQDFLQKQNKDKPFAVLDKAQQEEIARILAEGLIPPQFRETIQKELLSEFAKQAVLEASGQGRVKAFQKDPTLVAEAIKLAQDQASQSLSDATARGADPKELLGVAQVNLRALESIVRDAKSAGIPESEQLKQALEEMRKAAFDAFMTRVDQLLKAAQNALPSKDTKGRDALQKQRDRLLTLAENVDPSLLSTEFTNLAGAENVVTKAVTTSAGNVEAAALEALRVAKADAAALLAEAARLDEIAAHAIELDNPNVATHAEAAAAAARNKAAGLTPKKPTPQRANDPGAGPFDGGGGGGGTVASDTAEQIAAAKAAANVFPGAQVEQAAAAIRTAAADLHAQIPGTVAYYNALKSLRQSQYDYVQALLEAQHVARELHEDLTNPVVTAQETLRTAQAKLRSDQSKGAPGDVLNADRLAVQQATSALENTKFQQTLDTLKTNVDLGRITQRQYIHALDQQRDNLLAIHHRTFQQQQELNQIDQLLQEVAKQFQGQFNLGDIALPSVFQVRQQVRGGPGAQNGITQSVQVTINGNDLAAMKSVLAQYLGPAAYARGPVATQKV